MISATAQRPIKDAQGEQRLIARRAQQGFFIILLVLAGLAARYFYLQVLSHDRYATRSESNRVQVRPVTPNRGVIYDRRGRVLAENLPAYRLELIPEETADLEQTLARLAEVMELSDDDIERFRKNRARYREFESVPVKFNLDEQAVARFAVNRHRFGGVDVVPYLSRHYPYADMLTHVLGYVGRIDDSDLANVDPENYRGTTHIGKIGIERHYETELHGQSGLERVETNARGRVLRVLERQDPQAGMDIVLSIDIAVQTAAWNTLGERAGAVVAIDPNDGSVIAMVSKPAFDANAFVNGISTRDYQAILNAPRQPLFNRALAGGYEPGSTLKPFIGLAGIEMGVVGVNEPIFSNGEFFLEGQQRPFRDWKEGGHGWAEIRRALEESVNTYFYKVALDLGVDRIHEYLDQFGFGQPTGIDLPNEGSGLLPSRDWKRGRYGEPWYPGETVISGIGQGFNVVTPLQLANTLATLVNGGRRMAPRLGLAGKYPDDEKARQFEAPLVNTVPVKDPEAWQAVLDGMRRVVNGVAGTARDVSLNADYVIAGKTGTAQVFAMAADEKYEESEVAEHLRHHALFIAFAPFDSPQITVAVVVDHGGSGTRDAAPIARAVLDAWLVPDKNLARSTK
ncbi:MAG: penicillin-binding protein 2 [Xanthomonadales bacterium]|nr:penicillin-binding protein 2 [Gammaproteobacteria bacterium]NNE06560.1 penicillin-binding protein 2 [Xanthomonadales bacterium]NNL96364.1 penicillin-binding protein 2 [Xanthomonadales bacterium]